MKTGNTFRLAIGKEGDCRSSTWRVWSNPKGDIYIAVRCLGGMYKMSLHKDGKCQFGFTSEYSHEAFMRFRVSNRHLELWRLPTAPILRVLQILIPFSELADVSLEKSKNITWLDVPPEGDVGTISIFISEPSFELKLPENIKGGRLVAKLETAIRTAWITYAFTTPDDTLARIIASEKIRLMSLTQNQNIPNGTRVALFDSKNTYDRHILELACS